MAKLTRANLVTKITAMIATNGTEAITGAILQTIFLDTVASLAALDEAAFDGQVTGQTPTSDAAFTIKSYVDAAIAAIPAGDDNSGLTEQQVQTLIDTAVLQLQGEISTARTALETEIDDTETTLRTERATAIADLIGGAPAILDTFNELAAALNDDANFAATVMASIALKAPLLSPALQGQPTTPTPSEESPTDQITNKEYVDTQVAAVSTEGQIIPGPGNYQKGIFVREILYTEEQRTVAPVNSAVLRLTLTRPPVRGAKVSIDLIVVQGTANLKTTHHAAEIEADEIIDQDEPIPSTQFNTDNMLAEAISTPGSVAGSQSRTDSSLYVGKGDETASILAVSSPDWAKFTGLMITVREILPAYAAIASFDHTRLAVIRTTATIDQAFIDAGVDITTSQSEEITLPVWDTDPRYLWFLQPQDEPVYINIHEHNSPFNAIASFEVVMQLSDEGDPSEMTLNYNDAPHRIYFYDDQLLQRSSGTIWELS